MAAIFKKSSDRYLRTGAAIAAVLILVTVSLFANSSHLEVIDTGYSAMQPVPFSDNLHAGELGLDCYYCHSTIERARFVAIPATETCMNCRSRVRTDSPRLEKIRQGYAGGQPVPWVKVHTLPDCVCFNHSAHLSAGVSCVFCHGRVDLMTEIKQVKPLNMAFR